MIAPDSANMGDCAMERREALTAQVLRELPQAAGRMPAELITEDTDLACDCWLDGRGLWHLAGLIEERMGVTILPADLLDLALCGPTLGNLLDLLEVTLDQRAGAQA